MFFYAEFNFWKYNFQETVSPLAYGIVDLHDHILFFLSMILFLVLFLCVTTVVGFSYPNSYKSSVLQKLSRVFLQLCVKQQKLYQWLKINHGTVIEIIWTIIPSFILITIAIPSFALLYGIDEIIDPTLTIKVIGHQWYWSYEYSDYVISFSNFFLPLEKVFYKSNFNHCFFSDKSSIKWDTFFDPKAIIKRGWFSLIINYFKNPVDSVNFADDVVNLRFDIIDKYKRCDFNIGYNNEFYSIVKPYVVVLNEMDFNQLFFQFNNNGMFNEKSLSFLKSCIDMNYDNYVFLFSFPCVNIVFIDITEDLFPNFELVKELCKDTNDDSIEFLGKENLYKKLFPIVNVDKDVKTDFELYADYSMSNSISEPVLVEPKEPEEPTSCPMSLEPDAVQYLELPDWWLEQYYAEDHSEYDKYKSKENESLDFLSKSAKSITAQPITAQPITAQPITAQPITAQPITVASITASINASIKENILFIDNFIAFVNQLLNINFINSKIASDENFFSFLALDSYSDFTASIKNTIFYNSYKKPKCIVFCSWDGFVDELVEFLLKESKESTYQYINFFNENSLSFIKLQLYLWNVPSLFFHEYTFDSYLLHETDLNYGDLRLLKTDHPLILPKNVHIRFIITSEDVLHSWAVPSLGLKVDAVPGRLNQVSVYIKRSGIFYGQCSELCGVNHAFMPIEIYVFTADMYYNFLYQHLDLVLLDIFSQYFNKNFYGAGTFVDQLLQNK